MSAPPPEGYRALCPYLVTPRAEEVLAFAETVFGAAPTRPPLWAPDGRLVNVALEIGDGMLMLGAPPDRESAQTAMLHVYVADCDATYAEAVEAGAESVMPPADQPYGDRSAGVRDVAGNLWWIAQRVEELDHAEIARRLAEDG
jgi:uncharacterized glyoxalase superfamily protein PhnB